MTQIFNILPVARQSFYFAITIFLFCSCSKQEIRQPETTRGINTVSEDNLSPDEVSAIQRGLVAWYAFNGNTLDSSGHNNNVVFSNATSAAGADGVPNTAYYFNGIDNYMRVANNRTLNPSGAITIYALVSVSNFYTGKCHNNRILNKGLNDVDHGVYYLQFNDAFFYDYNQCLKDVDLRHQTFGGTYGDGTDNTADAFDSTNRIKAQKWYPIAYTYDGVTAKFYVNGRLVYSKAATQIFTSNHSDLFIGTSNIDNTTFPNWFNGTIDEIKIFKKALTDRQVRRLPNL